MPDYVQYLYIYDDLIIYFSFTDFQSHLPSSGLSGIEETYLYI